MTADQPKESFAQRLKTAILRPEILPLVYSVVDIMWAWTQWQHKWNELVQNTPADASLPSFESPARMRLDMYLMFLAAFGLWLRRGWSDMLTVFSGCAVLYLGFTKYQSILHSVDIVWSSSILRYWWLYANGEWDLPRFCLALVLVICALIRLARHDGAKRLPRDPRLTTE